MKRAPLMAPSNLRRPEARYAARTMADQILRADARRARRMRANDELGGNAKTRAPAPTASEPRRLTSLSDLRFHPLAPRRRGSTHHGS